MSFITNLLLQRLKDHLTQTMKDPYLEGDLTRANTIKIGRFQEDPTRTIVYIAITGGDPKESKEVMDGIVSLTDMEKIGMNVPPREIGGGQLWWRRGICQLGCFYVQSQLDEEAAAEKAYEVMGRLLTSIDTCPVADLVDTFGERAIAIYCYASGFIESGGPPQQYIWRGTIKWMALTERN